MASANPAIWINFLLPLSAVAWTPIVPTIADCSKLMLRNDSGFAILIRTDSADPNTQETLYPGTELSLEFADQVVFRSGVTIAFAEASSGTGPLIVRQLR